MPWKKNYKKPSRKRYTRKKKYVRRYKKSYPISKQLGSGFPAQNVVRMRYVTTTDINLDDTSKAGTYQWRANSTYDPDFTSTGHQPLGWDQWTAFYNHYVVLGSKITVTMTGMDSSQSGATYANMYLSDDSTIPSAITDMSTLIEADRGTTKLLNGFLGINSPRITSKYSAKKFFNIKDVKDNLDRLGAPVNSNPTEEAYFNLSLFAPNSASANVIQIMAVIEYIVLFSEPKDLPQS